MVFGNDFKFSLNFWVKDIRLIKIPLSTRHRYRKHWGREERKEKAEVRKRY
jgi:hypothetical protein